MIDKALSGSRILVIEDEYYIADDVRSALTELGVEVLGPIPSAREAQDYLAGHPVIDCALLDVNLRGQLAFDVADVLQERGIPFAFVTGYDRDALPIRYADVARIAKPVRYDQLGELLRSLPMPAKSAGSA